jgi:predicted ATPase/DNA-binding CsgD family transcriptional regulator
VKIQLLNIPHNLPQELTSFIGRTQELREIRRLLEANRIVTLTGAGGCGKTRLSLQVAVDAASDYLDGAWFVELATLTDPSLVAQAVASALGVREETGRSLTATLCDYLESMNLLLVLDNCEHLRTTCALLVSDLLSSCPGLRVLATSRERLEIEGEIVLTVPALRLPEPEKRLSVEDLANYEAIQLFVERARANTPRFGINEQNSLSIVQICRQLDGLPLAIELAAARVSVLAPAQIAARLNERFRLLGSGTSLAPSRHQTLIALLDWSYELLSEAERALLLWLSVFSGSFSLDAVGAVCDGVIDEYELINLLAHLINKSLVVVIDYDGEVRYRLLETIRQYAWKKLTASGDVSMLSTLRDRHRDWYLAFAEQAQAKLTSGEQSKWLDLLELEHDNLRSALEWSIRGNPYAESALRLSAALWRFWDMRGFISEGRSWLSDALAVHNDAPAQIRAKALNAAGTLAAEQSDYGQATVLYEKALALRRQAGDTQGVAASLSNLGVMARKKGDFDEAERLYKESLEILRDLGNLGSIASVLDNLGLVKQYQGDYKQADQLYGEALKIFKQEDDKQGISMALNNRGKMAQYQGNYITAKALYYEAQALASDIGDKLGVVGILSNLGDVANCEGDYEQAERFYLESLDLCQHLGCTQETAECLEGLTTAILRYQPERAARLLGAAETLHKRAGNSPLPPIKRLAHEHLAATLRSRLGEKAFTVAWLAGRAMAVDEVLAFPPDRTRKSLVERLDLGFPSPPYPAGLTRREVEVLRLLAVGMTDVEAAARLFLSRRTVHAHTTSIYSKLGVNTRGAAGRFAIDHNLL